METEEEEESTHDRRGRPDQRLLEEDHSYQMSAEFILPLQGCNKISIPGCVNMEWKIAFSCLQ